MNKKTSRLLALLLALVMLAGLAPSVLAASDTRLAEGQAASQELYDLGLLNGVGTLSNGSPDFGLANTMDRQTGVTVLVRLMGGEREAVIADYVHPFKDLTIPWSRPYISYAYKMGYSNGTYDGAWGSSTFSPQNTITADQFVTMLLRAMGYSEVDWKNPWPLAESVGMAHPRYSNFIRADMAVIALSALDCHVKGGNTLRSKLKSAGVIGKGHQTYKGFTAGPVAEPVTDVTASDINDLALQLAYASKGHGKYITPHLASGSALSFLTSIVASIEEGNSTGVYGPLDDYFSLAEGNGLGYNADISKLQLKIVLAYQDAIHVMNCLEGKEPWTDDWISLVNTAKSIVAQVADPSMSQYQLAKALHDYIVLHTEYDYAALTDPNDGAGKPPHTAYGCLQKGLCVCEGYMLGYDLLCYLVGIECIPVSGDNHTWNKVKIDGKWYNVDATWDDEGGSGISYDYFLVSDQVMRQSGHSWCEDYDGYWPDAPVNYK